MNKINWEIFFGDSSSESDVMEFAAGRLKFNEWLDNYIAVDPRDQNCPITKQRINAVKQMLKLGYKKAKPLAIRALSRRGYTYKEYKNDFCLC